MNVRPLVWKILLAAAIVAGGFFVGIYLEGCSVQAQFMIFIVG
jgi:hypothetical protein